MKVTSLVEKDDEVVVSLSLNNYEAQILMQEGFIRLLEDAIKQDKKRRRTAALLQENYGGCE